MPELFDHLFDADDAALDTTGNGNGEREFWFVYIAWDGSQFGPSFMMQEELPYDPFERDQTYKED